jgi:DNA-binding CsgD family transcriptional regulator
LEMPAENPRQRKGTAKELGKRFNRSPRTIKRIIAEPRADFEARSQDRQEEAMELKTQGLSYAEIGSAMGITRDSASGLVRRAKARVLQSA